MIVMDMRELARLCAIVFVTVLGTIAITLVPFLFADGVMEWVEFLGNIKHLLFFLGIGVVVGAVTYVILNLFQGSKH